MTFTEQATELISSAFGPLSPAHRISVEAIADAEKRLSLKLPPVLADYYRLAGNHPEASDGMNHLLKPADLYVSDDRLVFAEENQNAFSAGVLAGDLSKQDPPVSEQYSGHPEWHLVSNHLSRYLLVTFCWQACNALPSTALANLSPHQFDRMKKDLRWTHFGANPKADTVGLWGDRLAAVVFTDAHDLYIASHDDELLESFGQKWDLDLSMC